jgi:tryptophan synthase alpha chain
MTDRPRNAVPRRVDAAAQGPIPSPHPPGGISTVAGESARERVDSVPEANGGKALAVYLMAGPETPELAEAAVEGGADLVELGFPFSDPLADGPVIRRAAERALAQGMRTHACMECLAAVRERVSVPLVPMTYASLLEAYGYERFAADAEAAGATSLIVADLPAGERPELRRVQLVAPTSTDERIALAAVHTDGWLYLVTVAGTTGARARLSRSLEGLAGRARRLTDLPLYAGFGIATPEQARAAAELADGVVVGSRAVEIAEQGTTALRDYIRSLRVAIDANVGIIGRR